MKLLSRTALVASLLVTACGGSDEASIVEQAPDPGPGTGTSAPPSTTETPVTGGGDPIADLRADTNRDGEVKFDDPADDDGEDVWDAKHGAVFLANIDDDEEACSTDEDCPGDDLECFTQLHEKRASRGEKPCASLRL